MTVKRPQGTVGRLLASTIVFATVATVAWSATVARAQDPIRIGMPIFLSGAGVGSVGEPSRNAAELVIDALNAGTVPAPYNKALGFGGTKIVPKIIDEAGNTASVVTEFRNLVQRDKVDIVVGYFSSANCLAVSPVADELKTLTVFYGCGAAALFEKGKYKYVFRPTPHTTSDNVAAARYVMKKFPQLKSYSSINQNYSWGHDNVRDFTLAMEALAPQSKADKMLSTKLFAGEFGAEISALLSSGSTIIHSSFWGGDLEAFILQSVARGLSKRSTLVLPVGEQIVVRQAKNIPDGTIIGARGPHGALALDNPLSTWFRNTYVDKFKAQPNFPAYQMFQTILGLKVAWEKAAASAKSDRPTVDELAQAFKYLEFETASGPIMMSIGGGHQGIQDAAIGTYMQDKATGQPRVVDVVQFPATCVNPPDGLPAREWLEKGMPGAKC